MQPRFCRHLLVVFVFWAGAAHASEAREWLTRINDAAVSLNYHGTFVYAYGSSLEAMRVVHQVDGGVVRERIYSLNGSPREIIRNAEQVWCYVPERRIGVHEFREVSKQSFPNILPQSLDSLSESYKLSLGKVNRVAERLAQQILILPLDGYRYGYTLWADQETGLLLKAVLIEKNGEAVEQYMFTEVDIGNQIASSALDPITPKEDLKWFGVESGETKAAGYAELTSPGWKVESLPVGFKMARQIKRRSPIRKQTIEHYVYTDGLAAVSVFIEMIGDNSDPKITGLSRIGAVHAFGHSADGYHITVVGEVPPDTVDMIGTSVSPISE